MGDLDFSLANSENIEWYENLGETNGINLFSRKKKGNLVKTKLAGHTT